MSPSSPKGEVVLFFTGGTIGMSPTETGGVAPDGNFTKLLAELAPQPDGVTLRPVLWADVPSPHMTPEAMFRLSRDVDAALAEDGVLGAVVLHGTDTLLESSFMLDITLRTPKPVVFTGAMRYYSETGYDGLRNLVNSVRAVLSPVPPEVGVTVLMTDRLFAARDAVKVNSLNIDAFESGEAGILGHVAGDRVLLSPHIRAVSGRRMVEAEGIDTRVPLVTCYTGMGGDVFDWHRERGARGIVIEAFGAGNVPPGIIPAVERCLHDGLPVVVASRCIEGGVWPVYGYEGGAAHLERLGAVLCGRMGGPRARLLLMAALGADLEAGEISGLFDQEWS